MAKEDKKGSVGVKLHKSKVRSAAKKSLGGKY